MRATSVPLTKKPLDTPSVTSWRTSGTGIPSGSLCKPLPIASDSKILRIVKPRSYPNLWYCFSAQLCRESANNSVIGTKLTTKRFLMYLRLVKWWAIVLSMFSASLWKQRDANLFTMSTKSFNFVPARRMAENALTLGAAEMPPLLLPAARVAFVAVTASPAAVKRSLTMHPLILYMHCRSCQFASLLMNPSMKPWSTSLDSSASRVSLSLQVKGS
mmetsp:Transcript_44682/g.83823  ORF Transcript_44682/g.83823 Transcript_44682/m.83823 type:complete len:216 (-) Transcript_44682:195-842(-)